MAYTTAAAFREHASPSTFTATDATIDSLIDEFEQITEDYLGASYASRSATDVVVSNGGAAIPLSHTDATEVTALAYETGTAPTPSGETVTVDPGGLAVLLPRGNTFPQTKVTVTYNYGAEAPPSRLVRCCWTYVALVLNSERSGTGRDVISQAFDGATTRYSTPDRKAGRPTGWLEVDRILNSFPAVIPGMA